MILTVALYVALVAFVLLFLASVCVLVLMIAGCVLNAVLPADPLGELVNDASEGEAVEGEDDWAFPVRAVPDWGREWLAEVHELPVVRR